jgi:hypothetical protein
LPINCFVIFFLGALGCPAWGCCSAGASMGLNDENSSPQQVVINIYILFHIPLPRKKKKKNQIKNHILHP